MSRAGSKRKADLAEEPEGKKRTPRVTRSTTTAGGTNRKKPVDPDAEFAATAARMAEMDTVKAIESARFQALLAQYKIQEALDYAKRVGVQKIDFHTTYAPPPFVTCVHVLGEVLSSDPASGLLQLFQNAGLMTREAVSDAVLGPSKTNLLNHASSKKESYAFDFLIANLQSDVADWSVVSGDHWSPLHRCVSARHFGPAHPFIEENRAEFDRRGAMLVPLLPDDALNLVDNHGDSVLVACIAGARVLTLEALIRRLPALELEPELYLKFPGNPALAVKSVEVALLANNAPAATYKPLRPLIASLVQSARVTMAKYRKGLEPLLLFLLQHWASMPREVVSIMRGYLLH